MIAPKLRFSEFKEVIRESEIGKFTILMQSGLSRQLSDEDIGLPVLRSNNLDGNQVNITDIKYWYLEDPQGANTQNYFLDSNDLLVNFINSLSQIGKSAIYRNQLKRDTILTTNILRLKFNQQINPLFISYFFQTKKYSDYIQSITKPAVNQASFTTKDLAKLLIPVISIDEQTKIAEFLSAVDDKISQLSRQLELLNQYKKGVMQKIFSQEIRFKNDNGEDFGEWEKVKFSDIFIEIKDKVGNKNIETYSITAGKGFVSQSEKFGRDISGSQNENYIVLGKNDFSYNKGNSKTYKFGCVYLNNTGQNIAVPNVFISFRAKKNNIAHNFYAKLFEHHYLDRYLRQLISSSARMDGLLNISKEGFFEIPLPFPPIPEQEKIAEFLTAIDEQIDHTTAQLTHTKQWKKGLLQQMFV